MHGALRAQVSFLRDSESSIDGLVVVRRRTRGGEGTLEGDRVLLDRVDGVGGDGRHAVDEDGGDRDLLPLDRDLGGVVDLLDGLRDLGTDTLRASGFGASVPK